MNTIVSTREEIVSRRDAIRAGILSIAGLALAGCQSNGWEPLPKSDQVWSDPIGSNRHDPIRSGSGSASASLTARPAGVIPRREWTGATTIANQTNAMVRVNKITVHHDGMPPVSLRSRGAVIDRLELIRRSHVNARGWADIGYHYVVDPLGNVWEARPLIYQGAHVKDHNPRNMGVMVLGNFDEQMPTQQATRALDDFLGRQMTRFGVSRSGLVTHQELAPTACPGRSLQRHMVQARAGSLA